MNSIKIYDKVFCNPSLALLEQFAIICQFRMYVYTSVGKILAITKQGKEYIHQRICGIASLICHRQDKYAQAG